MDKIVAKSLFRLAGLPVAPDLIARRRVASLRHELYEAHRLIDGLHASGRKTDRQRPW
jgi:D-alanine-D-alanine ligase-like ATP-grasp enzyme